MTPITLIGLTICELNINSLDIHNVRFESVLILALGFIIIWMFFSYMALYFKQMADNYFRRLLECFKSVLNQIRKEITAGNVHRLY